MRPFARLALIVVTAVTLAACGGDVDVTGAPTATPAGAPDDGAPDDGAPVTDPLAAVVTFDGLSRDHVRGPLTWDQFPPVGGEHSPEWQTCGRYDAPVPPERAVHALEHGAVWIAHDPGMDVSALTGLVDAETHLLLSPVDGLDSPVVLIAWGARLDLDGVDIDTVNAFVDRYVRQGPEAAPCDVGGVGVPPSEPGPPVAS